MEKERENVEAHTITPQSEGDGTLTLKPAKPRGPVPIDFSDYTMEVFLLAGLIAYALNYMVGSGKNSSIAKQWSVRETEWVEPSSRRLNSLPFLSLLLLLLLLLAPQA